MDHYSIMDYVIWKYALCNMDHYSIMDYVIWKYALYNMDHYLIMDYAIRIIILLWIMQITL